MSRGFVREGDQEEPVVIPQRAVLPDHVINYVTPSGMKQLREVFDEVKAHLLTQNARSVDVAGRCLNRSAKGLQCAVGLYLYNAGAGTVQYRYVPGGCFVCNTYCITGFAIGRVEKLR